MSIFGKGRERERELDLVSRVVKLTAFSLLNFAAGLGIKVAIKPEYRITPPVIFPLLLFGYAIILNWVFVAFLEIQVYIISLVAPYYYSKFSICCICK